MLRVHYVIGSLAQPSSTCNRLILVVRCGYVRSKCVIGNGGFEKHIAINMAPRGRPPFGYAWVEGVGWRHSITGESFDPNAHRETIRARKRDCERQRYWNDLKGVRERRLQRFAESVRRKKPRQKSLNNWMVCSLRSDSDEEKMVWKEINVTTP